MVRGILAVIVAATMSLWTGVMLGQEASPEGHASHGEHSAADHGTYSQAESDDMGVESQPNRNRSQSFLVWFISSLGWRYALLLPAAALFSFVLTAVLVIAGKGKTTGAAVGFVVAIPLLVGLAGLFDGLMSSFMVIAASSSTPKPSVLAEGISMSIVTPLVGMFLMVPSYLLATIGLTLRALKGDPKP